MSDPHNLQRFVDAQTPVYPGVVAELRAGRKASHWMWFVFPQIAGLGMSAMAQRYAIRSLAEAEAYLAHPTLGARLDECTRLVIAAAPRPLDEILGYPDDLKFRSSMTLFERAARRSGSIFQQALDAFCGGVPDEKTLALLKAP